MEDTGDLGESDFIFLSYLAALSALEKAIEIGEDSVLIDKAEQCENDCYSRWLDAIDLQDGTDREIAECEKDALDAVISYLYDCTRRGLPDE